MCVINVRQLILIEELSTHVHGLINPSPPDERQSCLPQLWCTHGFVFMIARFIKILPIFKIIMFN